MKITKLHLKNYQQFKDLTLDFTHPKTGEPLNKICFIGRNGTGKTTILDRLSDIIGHLLTKENYLIEKIHPQNLVDRKSITLESNLDLSKPLSLFIDTKNRDIGFQEVDDTQQKESISSQSFYTPHYALKDIFRFKELDKEIEDSFIKFTELRRKTNSLSYIKGENSIFNLPIPKTSLNEALKLFQNFPVINYISNTTANNFWQKLIYHLRKRKEDREVFENQEENLHKTKAELIKEFDDNNPDILTELAVEWNKILAPAGLFFDPKPAGRLVQNNDNLLAYIKQIADGKQIPYNKLSTGIKSFIFQLGHVFAIHFNRKLDNSFLLADEPAQGLFPDFIYNLVGIYENIVGKETQMFMATHNPIVAAQFEPHERFILDFNKQGFVTVKRGIAPIGDDPNDILYEDFGVENLMHEQGIEQWNKYKDLKRQIFHLSKNKEAENGEHAKLNTLIEEMAEIGRKYKFE